MSSLLEHCQTVFNTMSNDCNEEDIWIGRLSELHLGLSISKSYTDKVIHLLKKMGCIEVISRAGGTTSESQVKVVTFPTRDLFLGEKFAGTQLEDMYKFKPKRVTSQMAMANELNKLSGLVSTLIGEVNEHKKKIARLEAANRIISEFSDTEKETEEA